jgi:hypothetical protein
MKRSFHGSCHCGAVRFVASLDLAQGTSRCNCSIGRKSRFWRATVQINDFALTGGKDALVTYQFGSGSIQHQFCSRCGVKVFGSGEFPPPVGAFYAVNVACLDDAGEDLLASPITYEDGKHDAWDREPTDVEHI